MTTSAEHIIVAGSENRPPMLEKYMYDSWASRIRLFIKGKKHGRMMLDLIDNGLLVYPTVEENRQTRPMKYSELTEAQQLQDDCNVQATNIILYDLPPDVLYSLFDKFAYVQGETLYKYYWRFSQLINDMHTIGMTMQQVQINTKFLNALPFEWSMFVTDVKLAKSLYTTSYDQFLVVLTFQQGEDLIKCINKAMAFLSAVASRVTVQQVQGRQTQSYTGTGNRGIAITSKGKFTAGQPRVEKLMLAKAQEAVQILNEEQLAFLANLGISEALVAQQIIFQNSSFQTKDLDAYDSDCDDLSSAKAVLTENLLSYDPEVLFEHADFQQDIDKLKQTLSNNVKEKESLSKTLTVFKTKSKEKDSKYIDKEIILEKNKELENIICKMYRSTQAMHMLTKPKVFYNDTHKQALCYQNSFHHKKAQCIRPTLYDGSVIAKEHAVISMTDDEETLILEEESRSKMLDKQTDPISIEKKIKFFPIDYSKLNKIKEDFGKCFVTQEELSAEQAFWLKHSFIFETPTTSHTHIRIEAPSELPKEVCKCLELETGLLKKKDFIEKDAYDKLVKSYSTLEKHCNSLELTTQLNQEIFQRENSGENLNAPISNQLFGINELKAQSQEKDTVIRKLKDIIKS
nr:hypothetical protein [Tanacetum cinerariifolium]GEX83971.1 hypothetical protein [Tanacetum cinerariifolium]